MKTILKKIIATVLEIESRLVLKKYKPFIITVTGSVGKTSTKDAIYTVLSAGARKAEMVVGTSSDTVGTIRRNEKSFNSEFGTPLTILGCENPWGNFVGWLGVISHGIELIVFKSEFPSTLILEVGADHPGDIKRVARWLKPDIAVVTKIGVVPVHIEFFPSRSALVEEKISLARAVKLGGRLILPADDPEVMAVRKDNPVDAFSYGINVPADISATFVETVYESDPSEVVGGRATQVPAGISFKLNYAGNSIPVKVLGVLGVQHVYPLVAASAVGLARGMTLTDIIDSFAEHKAPPGRMNILQGVNGSIIIDDTYNASPDAMAEALAVLRSLKTRGATENIGHRKIAVLGDMMELGKFSQEEHKRLGFLATEVLMGLKKAEDIENDSEINITETEVKMPEKVEIAPHSTVGELASRNLLVTVGQRAKMIRAAAVEAGMPDSAILSFDSSDEAGAEIAQIVQKGDIILVKGSQSPRLERVSRALLVDQSKAEELLVRQDSKWLSKK